MKKKLLVAFAIAAAMCCSFNAAAGLIDHGDVTGFPNVNVDAHLVKIAKTYFPEVRQTLPVGLDVSDHWVVQIWRDEIAHKVKAKNLNIPQEKLDSFVEYASYGRFRRGNQIVPAPHPELLEFELFARGSGEISKRYTHKEMPEAWKKLLALPLEQRKYTTIPVHYVFLLMRENRRQHLAETIAKALEALNVGCRDTQGCIYALCTSDGVWTYELPPIDGVTGVSPEDKILQYHRDLRAYTVNKVPEKRWRRTNDMDFWSYHWNRGDKAYSGNMMNAFYILQLEKEEDLRALAEKDPIVRDLIVAFGLTCRNFPHIRKVAMEFAAKSEVNLPVLALRVPYTEAKKLLAGKKEHAALLDLLTLKQLEGEAKIAAIDSYIATYPDYTKKDMPHTSIALNTHRELNALAGLELVKLGRYEEALKRWLNGSTPEDAAMIAEQIMTTDQLLDFCKKYTQNVYNEKYTAFSRHCVKGEHPFDLHIAEKELIHELVRNILARRLMRENRSAEAREWFTGPLFRELSELYFTLEEQVRNADSDVKKLDAMLQMAALMRFQGDKIYGTCLEPDNQICEGKYACIWGANLKGLKLNKPDLPRYSYRYKAAELYRKAAAFTQDRSIQAACYFTAGTLLKNIAPKVADADFKKLAKIAPELIEKNWFKPLRKAGVEMNGFYNRSFFCYSTGGIRNLKPDMPVIPEVKLPENDGKPETLLQLANAEYQKLKNWQNSWTPEQIRYAFYLAGKKGNANGFIGCAKITDDLESDPFSALAFYQAALAIEPDSADALLGIGAVYTGLCYYRETLELYHELADQKEPKNKTTAGYAAFVLMIAYSDDRNGVPIDREKIRFYLDKAADAGVPEAVMLRKSLGLLNEPDK